VIDDEHGHTIAAASSLEKAMRESMRTGANVEAARRVGKEIADRAKKAGVEKVVFDRGAYMYHGRVRALAEGAREGGLDF
jgi:large subunit ribosomal protein L18